MTSAVDISVEKTLELLDGPLASIAAGIAQDRYAFWLGSGISFGRMASLKELIARVLDHLQQRVTPDAGCRFRRALKEILRLAHLSTADQAAIDLGNSIAAWPHLESLIDRLASDYARLLDQQVDGELPDYLLWHGVNVPDTYGDLTVEPDSEHLCLAVLILEGVSSDMPSANWDGLVERAVDAIAPGSPAIVVCVEPDDLRKPVYKTRLYKFHGCAILAGRDQARYRPRLIGRQSQIIGWSTRAENVAMVEHLIDLATTKRTLMLGLSTQDVNIQAIFASAQSRMPWPWPSDPPAYVFSEDRLGVDQRILLQNVYREAYSAANRHAIEDSALIRAYAKPLLCALALHVVCSKLGLLIAMAPGRCLRRTAFALSPA